MTGPGLYSAVDRNAQFARCNGMLQVWLGLKDCRVMQVTSTGAKEWRVELWERTKIASSAKGVSFLDALANALQGLQ